MNYDQWQSKTCGGFMEDAPRVCLEHLVLYTRGESGGHPVAFAHATQHFCAEAAAQISTSLVADRETPLQMRLMSMSLLLLLGQWFGRIAEVDREEVQVLLAWDASDPGEQLEQVNLAGIVMSLSESEDEIRAACAAVERICDWLDLPACDPVATLAQMHQVVGNARRALVRIMCTPPDDE